MNRRGYKAKTHRHKPIKALVAYAYNILRVCEEIWEAADMLDTAVRDTVADGLAHLLYTAYDSQAVNLGLEGEAFQSYPGHCTAEWFRSRGFAEWYCNAAANLFRTSRPRVLSLDTIIRRGKNKVIRFKAEPKAKEAS